MKTSKKITQFLKRYTAAPLFTFIGKRREAANFNGVPVIIGACPRSGTTLLLSILGADKRFFAIPHQTYAFDRWAVKTGPDGQEIYIPTHIYRLYREFVRRRIPKDAYRWIEKTPRHVQSYKQILQYFGENVRIINLIRDGRDIVTSNHPRLSPDDYYVPVERWIMDINYGLEFEDHPQVLHVKYEDLTSNFDQVIRKIYTFLGEELTDEVLNWMDNTTIRKSKHWDKPVQAIHTQSIRRWQKPEHKEVIDNFLKQPQAVLLLKKLGYTD